MEKRIKEETINEHCRECIRACKQSAKVTIINCRDFINKEKKTMTNQLGKIPSSFFKK